ncbi:hypothetical protein F5X68DRAFT_32225 [Plectosphaerella plurivora]|uniref:Uncharacterized protein n=1 Tax=Plectosphaerella plurivora TaxID=936078 RepID=A0A9P9ACU2_9PEZI|nr:hypothetical protein F5X68DRAFT_32225 [Plectosphaerella plurivora]
MRQGDHGWCRATRKSWPWVAALACAGQGFSPSISVSGDTKRTTRMASTAHRSFRPPRKEALAIKRECISKGPLVLCFSLRAGRKTGLRPGQLSRGPSAPEPKPSPVGAGSRPTYIRIVISASPALSESGNGHGNSSLLPFTITSDVPAAVDEQLFRKGHIQLPGRFVVWSQIYLSFPQ